MSVRVQYPGQRLMLDGVLDASSAPDVRLALHEALDHGVDDLVIDLAALQMLDATGLGVLVGSHRRAGRLGRRLVLTGVPPQVERMLLVTRLHRVLHVETDAVA